jgi:FkbM family methyltransferase
MGRDTASEFVPSLLHADGQDVGVLLAGPPGMARPWRRAVARLRSGRLPTMTAAYADGRRFVIDAGDVMYEQVYRLGEYEPTVTRAIRGLLRIGDVAVDVGANHGWFSLVMALGTGATGRTHAIEPVPALAGALRRNLALNPHLDVDVHEMAVGAHEGELELHTFEDLSHGHTSAATLGRDHYTTHLVPCRRLDDLVAHAALVKVDVEGYELEVLSGATKLFDGGRGPIWLIEANYETAAAFGRRPAAALSPLEDHGYSIFRIENDGVFLDADVDAAPHGATWLCVPEAHLHRVRAMVGKRSTAGRGSGNRPQ